MSFLYLLTYLGFTPVIFLSGLYTPKLDRRPRCDLGKYYTTDPRKSGTMFFFPIFWTHSFLSSHVSMSAFEVVAIVAPTATLAQPIAPRGNCFQPFLSLIRLNSEVLFGFQPIKSPKISPGPSHADTPSKSGSNGSCSESGRSLALHSAEGIQRVPHLRRCDFTRIYHYFFFFFFPDDSFLLYLCLCQNLYIESLESNVRRRFQRRARHRRNLLDIPVICPLDRANMELLIDEYIKAVIK